MAITLQQAIEYVLKHKEIVKAAYLRGDSSAKFISFGINFLEEDATKESHTKFFTEAVELFSLGFDWKQLCPERPELLLDVPVGQYHCPYCGLMLLAGASHALPDEWDYQQSERVQKYWVKVARPPVEPRSGLSSANNL